VLLVTGLVGAGGGFLIVPALVLLVRLLIKIAIATSLVIISIKSLIGFLGDLGSGQLIDWTLPIKFYNFFYCRNVFLEFTPVNI
jgi:uncharacterized membrane protein YfcA